MKYDRTSYKLTISADLKALTRIVFPKHTVKRLATLIDIPLDRARCYLHQSFSRHAFRTAAALLLDELDRQDREERAEARQRLQQIINGGSGCFGRGSGDGSDE